MALDPAKVTKYMGLATSLRGAWRLYCENETPVAWDTFRKRTAPEFLNIETTPPKIGIALYDLHFPHEDKEAIEIALNYVEDEIGSPEYLIIGGDAVDCESISKFGSDPFDTLPIHEELEYARDAIRNIVARVDANSNYFIAGNHEMRLQKYLQTRAPEIARLKGLTIADQLGLAEMGVEWVDNIERKSSGKGYFKIGKLFIGHGHEFNLCPLVSPARRYFMKTFSNCIQGHIHRADEHFERDLSGDVLGSWTVGCLCNLTPTYRPINSWTQGFAVIKWYEDGTFSVDLKKIIGGRVL